MKIFYTKLSEEIIKNLTRIEVKKLQSELGHKIVIYAAQKFYGVKDFTIEKYNNKPKFKFSDVQFNISHSYRVIAVVFDDYPAGIDVEFMKERNFSMISRHYDINADNKIDFYKKWTRLEADIKIQAEVSHVFTEVFEDNYMLTVSSSNPEDIKPEIVYIEPDLLI